MHMPMGCLLEHPTVVALSTHTRICNHHELALVMTIHVHMHVKQKFYLI